MSNKIKDIFSDDMIDINGTLSFCNKDAYNNFLSALDSVYTEGRTIPIDGVTSISTSVGCQGAKFPLQEHTSIEKVFIGPTEEPVIITLDVNGEEKKITLLRNFLKDKVIIHSKPDSIVAFNFIFQHGENKHTVNYKVQFEKAKSVSEVADSFSIATALLSCFYGSEDNTTAEAGKVSLSEVRNYFRCNEAFFKRLSAIESRLSLSISPSLLNDLSSEEQHDIDELYLLLCEKKVVRLNAKLSSTESIVVMNQVGPQLSIGSKVSLTFLGNIESIFLKQKVTLYTANLLINAFVKDIRKCEDGTVKILYGDTDSKPMYVSFSAFETSEEARQELDVIMQHEEIYNNALTSSVYINEYYEEKD
ncbi:abortive infection system toxin AbiGii family protein [Anaerotignum lactatifermentans]|uniref:abortive infection system toxin AbiGii family protein n=1 Tax=Anaerotignum lactatifermentans TaxID=160404 RepID=UPI0018757DC1|nr:abortive infection system toxin AbiGii family protein [Anaerotignum lactatifermentans]MBE5077513.1 hypothetical protein [Anaerotignum lactatifermentans]